MRLLLVFPVLASICVRDLMGTKKNSGRVIVWSTV